MVVRVPKTAYIATLFLCVFLLSGTVYVLTLAPSLTWAHMGGDGGDFVTAAVTGRIPHPPGFPVYMTLARAFVRLPWRDPAWRLNLLSAMMAACTAGIVAVTVWWRGQTVWSALSAGLALAFAPLFWSQALITEVYTTAAFFVATALLAWHWASESERFLAWCATGLCWGLAASAHMTTLVLILLWWLVLRYTQRKSEDSMSSVGTYASFGAGFVLGLLSYALLPFWKSWPQPWGDMRTVAGWWNFVRGRLYWGYAFGLSLADWPRRLLTWVALMVRQFTPIGALIVILGAWVLLKREQHQAIGILAVLGFGSLYAIGYDTPDSVVYLVPLLPLLVLLLAEGFGWLFERGVPKWSGFVLPLILLVWNWQSLTLRNDFEAVNWLHSVLARLPENAIVQTKGDEQTFTLWYVQSALGLRPDVLCVDRDLWQLPYYREFLELQTGRDITSFEAFVQDDVLCWLDLEEVVCP